MGLPALFAAGAGASALGAYQGANAQKASLQYQAAVASNNAKLAEMKAKDAIDNGRVAVQKHRRDVKGFRGKQVNAMSDSGLLIGSESFQDVLNTTDVLGELDAITIMTNAERQAFGFNVEADNSQSTSGMLSKQAGSIQPLMSAGTSLLTSYVGYKGLTGG